MKIITLEVQEKIQAFLDEEFAYANQQVEDAENNSDEHEYRWWSGYREGLKVGKKLYDMLTD